MGCIFIPKREIRTMDRVRDPKKVLHSKRPMSLNLQVPDCLFLDLMLFGAESGGGYIPPSSTWGGLHHQRNSRSVLWACASTSIHHLSTLESHLRGLIDRDLKVAFPPHPHWALAQGILSRLKRLWALGPNWTLQAGARAYNIGWHPQGAHQ